jgi:hypothetical protein
MRAFYEPVKDMMQVVMQFEGVPFDVPVQRIIQDELNMTLLSAIATSVSPYAAARDAAYDVARRLSPLGVTLQDLEGAERWRREDDTFILVSFYKNKDAVKLHANMVRVMYDIMRGGAHGLPVCPSFYIFFSDMQDNSMPEHSHDPVAVKFFRAFVQNNYVLARCGGTKLLFAFVVVARAKGSHLQSYSQCLSGKQSFGKLGQNGLYKINKKRATNKDIEVVGRVYEAILDYMQYMHQTYFVRYGSQMIDIRKSDQFEEEPYITTARKVYKHFTEQWILDHRPELCDKVVDIFEEKKGGNGYCPRYFFPRAFVRVFFRETFHIPEGGDTTAIRRYILYKNVSVSVRDEQERRIAKHLEFPLGITPAHKRARIYMDD